ncbi:LLM class F420-dependent oxidoreductase [Actinomadura sp. SCN-SB]|uniref:LLM class F420-dependent oxidoreductase n=1 Tax=Actinomadura sp. SCN-SB TaxID=3373092 RepID=UPI003753D6CB
MTLRYNLMFPMRAVKHYERWIGKGDLGDVARAVESAGFDAIAMSEHPYPDEAWLSNGGHHAFDPFVSLSMMAAATERLRVITYVMVAGYRNPYLAAKAAASLDLLSRGRLTLGMAAGYLKAEFTALGADFGRRGALLDEAIAAMRASWDGVDHEGPEFGVRGHRALPGPAQKGGPPIWIGGNSGAARRRAATLGQGWMPIVQGAEMAAITRTPPLEDMAALRELIADMNRRRDEVGGRAMDVVLTPFEKDELRSGDAAAFCAAFAPRRAEYEDAGVTWITIEPPSRSFEAFKRDVGTIGDRVIGR